MVSSVNKKNSDNIKTDTDNPNTDILILNKDNLNKFSNIFGLDTRKDYILEETIDLSMETYMIEPESFIISSIKAFISLFFLTKLLNIKTVRTIFPPCIIIPN